MRTPWIVVAALAVAGVPAYLWVHSSVLDVSPEHPLGTFGSLDGWLRGKKFRHEVVGSEDRAAKNLAAAGLEDITLHRYRDPKSDLASVLVAVDPYRRVRAVRADFVSGSEEMLWLASSTQRFAITFFQEVTGAKPVFEEEYRGRGVSLQQFLVAKGEGPRYRGEWRKRYLERMKPRSIVDTLAFFAK